jgi:hypothetical protein
VEQVDVGIKIGRGGNRRPAQRHHLARGVRAFRDIVDAGPLDMHSRDKHGIGPGELFRRDPPDVLVHKFDFPTLGEQGHHQQNTLRRHEAPHVAHQREGVVESSETVTVTRERAENPAPVARFERAQRRRFFIGQDFFRFGKGVHIQLITIRQVFMLTRKVFVISHK